MAHAVLIHDDKLAIRLEYNVGKFWTLKEKIKQHCTWNSTNRLWFCRNGQEEELREILLMLREELSFTDEAISYLRKVRENQLEAEKRKYLAEKISSDYAGKQFERMAELYPFQRAGVEYAVSLDSVLIADEMGLGKTVQAIATVIEKKHLPCLVICPASLKLNWKREIEKWTDCSCTILNGCLLYTSPSPRD